MSKPFIESLTLRKLSGLSVVKVMKDIIMVNIPIEGHLFTDLVTGFYNKCPTTGALPQKVHLTWIDTVDVDPTTIVQPPAQLGREHDDGQLGLTVGLVSAVLGIQVQVVH